MFSIGWFHHQGDRIPTLAVLDISPEHKSRLLCQWPSQHNYIRNVLCVELELCLLYLSSGWVSMAIQKGKRHPSGLLQAQILPGIVAQSGLESLASYPWRKSCIKHNQGKGKNSWCALQQQLRHKFGKYHCSPCALILADFCPYPLSAPLLSVRSGFQAAHSSTLGWC